MAPAGRRPFCHRRQEGRVTLEQRKDILYGEKGLLWNEKRLFQGEMGLI